MQCPSCGFQNLPGLQQCARCMGTLDFAHVDVQPYRASQRWVRWRHWQWRQRNVPPLLSRLADYVRDEWERTGLGARARGPNEPTIPQRLKWVAASVVPGLGHLLTGEKRRGWWILAAYVLALLFMLVFMSSWWPFFMALAIGIHTFAVVEAIFRRSPFPRWQPVVVSLLMMPILLFGLYHPAGWVINGFIQLQRINGVVENQWLRNGDVLLLRGRWLLAEQYRPGDVVLYNVPPRTGPGWQSLGGFSVDRILAGPGDRVTITAGQIQVNARPLPSQRGLLGRAPLPPEHEAVVPSGHFFIYPSLTRVRGNNANRNDSPGLQMRLALSLVPAPAIRGRPIAIANPVSRIRRLGGT